MLRLVFAIVLVCSWLSFAEHGVAAQPIRPEIITTPSDMLKPNPKSKDWMPSGDAQTVEQKAASDEADEYRHEHEKKKKVDEDDHLIPFKYKKYFAAGLYRPWTFLPDYKYWYGPKYHPWAPGVRTLYKPGTKNPNYVDNDPMVKQVAAVVTDGHGATGPAYSNFAAGMQSVPATIAAGAPMANPAPMMGAIPSQPIYSNNAIQNPWQATFNAGYAPQPMPMSMPGLVNDPNNCNCQQGANWAAGLMPGPGYNAGGPVYSASYWPRHAGSYSPFVGYYGYGGRYHYGYGPYNYNWNQGIRYAGYGWVAGPGVTGYGYNPYNSGYPSPYGNNVPGYGYGAPSAGGGVSRFGWDGTFNYGYSQSGLAY